MKKTFFALFISGLLGFQALASDSKPVALTCDNYHQQPIAQVVLEQDAFDYGVHQEGSIQILTRFSGYPSYEVTEIGRQAASQALTKASATAFLHRMLPETRDQMTYATLKYQKPTAPVALDCSASMPKALRYASSGETIDATEIPEAAERGLIKVTSSYGDGQACARYERSYPSGSLAIDQAINHSQTAQFAFYGHCQGRPALWYAEQLNAQGQVVDSQHAQIPLNRAAFMQKDFSGKIYLNQPVGISDDGETLAMAIVEHVQPNHVMMGALEVLVLKNNKLYRLPKQITVNTAGSLSKALLSRDGNKIVVAHGSSIKLLGFEPEQDAFVVLGEHSLTSLLPYYYAENSLRISPDGLNAYFETYFYDAASSEWRSRYQKVQFTPQDQ
jgi:hypothetical protein